jgi:tetratricopeptide (TPR) repeat protein
MYEEAINCHNRALEIRKNLLGDDDPSIGLNLVSIGMIHRDKREDRESLEYFERGMQICLQHFDDDSLEAASYYTLIAVPSFRLGNLARSKELANKALKIFIDKLGPNHPKTADCYYSLGWVEVMRGEHQAGLEIFNKMLEILQNAHGEMHPHVAQAYFSNSFCYVELGDNIKALEFDVKSVEIHSALRPHHPMTAIAFGNAGVSAERLENFDLALKYLHESLNIFHTLAAKGQQVDITTRSKTHRALYRVYTAKGDTTNANLYANI